MNKKPINLDESNPFRIPGRENSDSNPEDNPVANVINDFRTGLLPSSQASPAKEKIYQRLNYTLLLGILLIVLILSLVIYVFTGFGRLQLEKSLGGFLSKESTSTPQLSLTPITATDDPAELIISSRPSPTIKSTWTPAVVLAMTNTAGPKMNTPTNKPVVTKTPTQTPTQDCENVQTITISDVGKILCVRGIIQETIENPTNFLVIFGNQKGAFYWVSYDMVWSQGEVDSCYQITGKVEKIGNSPIMIFDYSNIPEECP